jgi:hypothetical protein
MQVGEVGDPHHAALATGRRFLRCSLAVAHRQLPGS